MNFSSISGHLLGAVSAAWFFMGYPTLDEVPVLGIWCLFVGTIVLGAACRCWYMGAK